MQPGASHQFTNVTKLILHFTITTVTKHSCIDYTAYPVRAAGGAGADPSWHLVRCGVNSRQSITGPTDRDKQPVTLRPTVHLESRIISTLILIHLNQINLITRHWHKSIITFTVRASCNCCTSYVSSRCLLGFREHNIPTRWSYSYSRTHIWSRGQLNSTNLSKLAVGGTIITSNVKLNRAHACDECTPALRHCI